MTTIEDLHDGDQEAAYRLGQQAFGGTDWYDPDRPGIGDGRHVAAYQDGVLVGQVRRHAFGQFFGGRRLACAGISGVAVAPQARGRALARRMLHESLDRAAGAGEVIAALYPTTATLYRSVGFEVAGWWAQCGIPVGDLPADDGATAWERADVDDPRAVAVYERMAPDHDGWIDPDQRFWTWRAMQAQADSKTNRYLYLGLRDGEPVAAVQYAYATSRQAMYRIDGEVISGVDGAAVRAALAFLGANGTTADEVRTTLPVDLLSLHLAHAQHLTTHRTWPWMLAFVDLPGAIAARGYPPGVSGSVDLAVDDPHRPANGGRWVLAVTDGRAALEPGGDGRAALTVTDLAALFTGHLDPLRLARAGRLGQATDADLGLLRAAFAGQPSLPLFF